MKTIGRVILLIVFAPLLLPLGFIAIMLNPLFEIYYQEDKDNGNSK